MKTRITELLGIEYPVIQGGMAWVAEHHLAAAVSEAGGLGLIGGANAPGEVVRQEIRKARELTKKPIGVNIMLMSPYADEVAKVVVEEGVQVVTTGAGNPGKYMKMWKDAGIVVIPVVASVAKESIVHENYKKRVIGAKDIDSAVTGRSHGHPVRCLRNQMTRQYVKLEEEGKSFEELEYLTLGGLRKAVMDGDVTDGVVMAGQIAGMVKKEQTCKEMIEEMMEQAEKLLAR